MILIFIMHAFFGMAFPISKMLLSYTTPFFFTAVRISIAGLLLLAYQLGYARTPLKLCKRTWLMYIQVIFFGGYVTYILRFWGLSQLSSSNTAFLFNTSPFFTAFYAYLLEKERLSKLQWLGLAVGFIGVLPILLQSSINEKSMDKLFIFSWAELSILASVATQCYSWMIIRRLIRRESHHPVLINGIHLTIGGGLALCTSFAVESVPPITNIGFFMSWLFVVILLNNIISHNLYAYLLQKHYSPTFLSFTSFLSPLFAALYGWLMLNEQITYGFYLSSIMVLIGLYLFYRHELPRLNAQTT